MRIGLYGGSFDPVHYGHLNVARSALSALSLDRLVVLPAAVSPFKTNRPIASGAVYGWAERLEMIRAVFGQLEKTVVDDRELKRGGVSYAIDTVREIAAENPDAEIFFIIGEDSVAGLERWKDYDALRRLCSFKSFPRTEESSTSVRELFARRGVRVNGDGKIAAAVREGLVRKGGFCPCRLAKSPEFFCPCEEFRAQLADEDFHGFCHCRLYEV